MPASHENSHFAKKGSSLHACLGSEFFSVLNAPRGNDITSEREHNSINLYAVGRDSSAAKVRFGRAIFGVLKGSNLGEEKSLTELCQSLPTVAGHERDAFWPTWTVNRKKG